MQVDIINKPTNKTKFGNLRPGRYYQGRSHTDIDHQIIFYVIEQQSHRGQTHVLILNDPSHARAFDAGWTLDDVVELTPIKIQFKIAE